MTVVENDQAAEFARRASAHRPELLAHCYRMTGSVQDAEDLVQETFLRAWRAQDSFEGRASLRTWLYRIATNVCLTALSGANRRVLPADLSEPQSDPRAVHGRAPEVPWLEPFPDVLLRDDPAVIVAHRTDLRLALIAALQHLAPRQRAALILRDGLAWSAAEVAELLGTSPQAVNSALQRARARLEELAPEPDGIAEPAEPRLRSLLDRYAAAFADADLTALAAVLTEDVSFQMPPNPSWFSGRDQVLALIGARWPGIPGHSFALPVEANGGPALALYLRARDGALRAHSLLLARAEGDRIAAITTFHSPELFVPFGLPATVGGHAPVDGVGMGCLTGEVSG